MVSGQAGSPGTFPPIYLMAEVLFLQDRVYVVLADLELMIIFSVLASRVLEL